MMNWPWPPQFRDLPSFVALLYLYLTWSNIDCGIGVILLPIFVSSISLSWQVNSSGFEAKLSEKSYNGEQKKLGLREKPFQAIVRYDPAPKDNFLFGFGFIPSSPHFP